MLGEESKKLHAACVPNQRTECGTRECHGCVSFTFFFFVLSKLFTRCPHTALDVRGKQTNVMIVSKQQP